MPIKKIRLLIVDDSLFFRRTLQEFLSSNPRIEVVGTAVDAIDAMDKIKKLNPDVVTLDVEMPKLNGIDFLKQLMPQHPLPVIVVSSAPIRALDALDAGAVDFVRKPEIKGPQDLAHFMTDLIQKIYVASISKVKNQIAASTLSALSRISKLNTNAGQNTVIALGASTGGTEATIQVVQSLPADTPGIVIVQHMPAGFTNMYAQRLNRICKMSVVEAQNGDRVERGKIIIAAGEYHLRLAKDARGYYVQSERGAKVNGHCPSVDVLFDSVAEVAKADAMGIILTGMGADGAKGLLKMRQAGAYTVGQDKESCVVYGMPMVAFDIGGVQKQLPLTDMAGEIIRYLNTRRPL